MFYEEQIFGNNLMCRYHSDGEWWPVGADRAAQIKQELEKALDLLRRAEQHFATADYAHGTLIDIKNFLAHHKIP